MPPQRTRGIIVRSRDYSETSRLVTCLTADAALLRMLAKGAQRNSSPLRGKLETLNYGHLIYYPSRSSDLHLLSQFDLVDHFPAVSSSLERLAFCHYLTELCSATAFGVELSAGLFQLLLYTLRHADQITTFLPARIWFEIRFLYLLGVLPPLARCARCSQPIEGGTRFHPPESRWLCRRCSGPGGGAIELDSGVLAVIRYLRAHTLEQVMNLRLSPRQAGVLQRVLRYLIDSSVNCRLKSRHFLDQIIQF